MDLIEIDIPCKTKTINMNKARIWVSQIKLFENAFIDVRLLDDNGSVQECHLFILEHDEYKEWKEDQYLIDWVKEKLKLL